MIQTFLQQFHHLKESINCSMCKNIFLLNKIIQNNELQFYKKILEYCKLLFI